MKHSLKQGLKNHLQPIKLSTQQLKHLQRMQSPTNAPRPRRRMTAIFGVAAAGLVLFTVGLNVLLMMPRLSEQHNIEQRIAVEVAKNHLKLKPLEITSTHIEDIKRYFTELDFRPVTPQLFNRQPVTLLGGRYCSIQGVSAAQLRLKDSNNRIQSLYQSEFDVTVFGQLPKLEAGEPPMVTHAKGLKITIWVEKDILFALVEEQKMPAP